MKNWRGLWLAAVILAQKIWDDHPLKTSAFCSILPCVSKKSLRDIELAAFCLPNFCTSVKPSQYAKCYFGLRELYAEMIGQNNNVNHSSNQFDLKPLSLIESLRLEDRSFRNGYLRHGVHHSHSRHHRRHHEQKSNKRVDVSSSVISSTTTTTTTTDECSVLSSASTDLSNLIANLHITNTCSTSKASVDNEKLFANMMMRHRSLYCNQNFSNLDFFPTKTLEDATVVNTTRFVIS
jgi:hypothetical protein